MTQKPYFRDVWALGPPNTGYPGAFPRGFIEMIKKKWWGTSRLWLFSGSFKDTREGITFDIKKELKPTVSGNCEVLPFRDESFDFVFADPPYSKEESEKLYNIQYVNIIKTLNEMIRVCKPGGKICFLHRLVPSVFPGLNLATKTQMVGVVGVFTIAGMANMRALTVFEKRFELRCI